MLTVMLTVMLIVVLKVMQNRTRFCITFRCCI